MAHVCIYTLSIHFFMYTYICIVSVTASDGPEDLSNMLVCVHACVCLFHTNLTVTLQQQALCYEFFIKARLSTERLYK